MHQELRVGIKFKLCKYISEGTFGKLYSGINVKTNEEVAVKLV
jgi:serine/threonine protein kinase